MPDWFSKFSSWQAFGGLLEFQNVINSFKGKHELVKRHTPFCTRCFRFFTTYYRFLIVGVSGIISGCSPIHIINNITPTSTYKIDRGIRYKISPEVILMSKFLSLETAIQSQPTATRWLFSSMVELGIAVTDKSINLWVKLWQHEG